MTKKIDGFAPMLMWREALAASGYTAIKTEELDRLHTALSAERERAARLEAELAMLEHSANDWILKNNTEWQGRIISLPAFFQARLSQLEIAGRAMLDAEQRADKAEQKANKKER